MHEREESEKRVTGLWAVAVAVDNIKDAWQKKEKTHCFPPIPSRANASDKDGFHESRSPTELSLRLSLSFPNFLSFSRIPFTPLREKKPCLYLLSFT